MNSFSFHNIVINSDMKKQQILGYTIDDLKQVLKDLGEKPFRAEQIYTWIYKNNVHSFSDMQNISKHLRNLLNDNFTISCLKEEKKDQSKIDKTVKYLFKLDDGNLIESVYMRDGNRVTLCVSTMVGCPVKCPYCATGLMGLQRKLTTAEIVNQLLIINNSESKPITNIVFMGMGEPFLNYANSIKAAQIFNAPSGCEISARKITISTCGIIPAIIKYADEGWKFKLAISLNGVNKFQRDILIPYNKKYPLEKLLDAVKYYTKKSGQRVTFEYILINDFNDSTDDAKEIRKMLRSIPCKLNIIPFNENSHVPFKAPSEKNLNRFLKILYKAPFAITVRRSKGPDIAAACGQLFSEYNKK